MRRTDPRIRQTINQISHNIESANIATQASLFSFSQAYIAPCLASFHSCLEASCHPCFRARDDQRKPRRNAHRGRDELAFEFYDDWDEEAGEWGNDELDRLLARSDQQPGRHGSMSYGSRIIRRKSLAIPKDGNADPNVVPSSSMFGFLERFPWKIGRRGRRYRPSAADLRENVGRARGEGEALIDDTVEGGADHHRGRPGRNRSATAGSQSTSNSFSSRGDLFPSEDEDDAVPIDDEFAMLLARRNTGTTTDDHSSGQTQAKRTGGSRASTKTASSKGTRHSLGKSASAGSVPGSAESEAEESQSLSELKHEEEHARKEEEAEIERKRQAAQKLARQRGLSSPIGRFTVSFIPPLPPGKSRRSMSNPLSFSLIAPTRVPRTQTHSPRTIHALTPRQTKTTTHRFPAIPFPLLALRATTRFRTCPSL